jgi:hypothetical protein
MRSILLTCLITLFLNSVTGQISFLNFDSKLKAVAGVNGTALSCTGKSFSIEFRLKNKKVPVDGNFAFVDSQAIQITPLSIKGLKKETAKLTNAEQKQLLIAYAKYELDYFTELKIEVIDPHNQWVAIKNRYWFMWYFRVGKQPVEMETKASVQLFASTIVSGKVLTINAPIFEGGDFSKAGQIVNEMMESLTVKSTGR